MMILDKTSEKLRSKHVRTLELLQKTLDENGTLHLGQGLPRSNRSSDLEDEIDRLKDEHGRTLVGVEEAARVKLAEQTQAVEALTSANSKLKNDLLTLDAALRDARDTLRHERLAWKDERTQLEAAIAEATKTQPPASPSRIEQQQLPPEQDNIEEEKIRLQLEAELEQSRQAVASAESTRQALEAQVVTLRGDLKQAVNAASSQRTEITALQTQLTAAQVQEKALSDQLKTMRGRTRSLEIKTSGERPSSTTNAKLLLQQKTLLAKLQDLETRHAELEAEHHALQDRAARLQQQFLNEVAQRKADAAESGIFAIHVELKRENFQLRTQVEELKALQKQFLTPAKKKSMSFPAL
ncbi:hypothetical protein BBJ28_00000395 [Nothophytophthora sp. Chile5]|nr:hypothetical protein BBJ28_00000395 [Nothophytophthora sp. Chile5]